MLLTSLTNSTEGLFGRNEKGEDVRLTSVPIAHAVTGKARYIGNNITGTSDGEFALKRANLMNLARGDKNKFYYIEQPTHNREQAIFTIPYLTFKR